MLRALLSSAGSRALESEDRSRVLRNAPVPSSLSLVRTMRLIVVTRRNCSIQPLQDLETEQGFIAAREFSLFSFRQKLSFPLLLLSILLLARSYVYTRVYIYIYWRMDPVTRKGKQEARWKDRRNAR